MSNQTENNKWYPIATAPEDVNLIVLRRDGVMHIAKIYGDTVKYGVLASMSVGGAYFSAIFPEMLNYNGRDAPTHWMPLPLPPTSSQT